MTPDDMYIKTTWRMPKNLIKQMKQYALDHDTTLTKVAIEAFKEYLQRKKKE
ncbi:MAG TPA: hypothetical protein VEL11_17050 [Candidatus Bathyarchaeia archaeon]|nr:hypothetical protein [Candidatus Bathyarchaeia archaeon]